MSKNCPLGKLDPHACWGCFYEFGNGCIYHEFNNPEESENTVINVNNYPYLTIVNKNDEKEIPTIDKNKIEQFKKDLKKYNNKGKIRMTNTEAIKILYHIANSLIEQYVPEEDKEVYNEAIEKAVNALLFERVSNLKANRKRRK